MTARRPPRIPVARGVGGQPAHVVAVDVHQPQIGAAAVGLQIGGAQGEDDGLTIGGNLGVTDAVHGQHVVDREGVRIRGEGHGGPARITSSSIMRRKAVLSLEIEVREPPR